YDIFYCSFHSYHLLLLSSLFLFYHYSYEEETINCRDCPSFKQSAPSSSFKLQIYKFAIYFYLISKLKPYSELIPSQNRSKLNLSYLLSKCALCSKHVVNYLKKKRSRSPSLKVRVLGI